MIVQYITAYYRWGNRQRPPFILSIRVWPSAVLRIKSSYHHLMVRPQRAKQEPGPQAATDAQSLVGNEAHDDDTTHTHTHTLGTTYTHSNTRTRNRTHPDQQPFPDTPPLDCRPCNHRSVRAYFLIRRPQRLKTNYYHRRAMWCMRTCVESGTVPRAHC